MLGVPRPRRAHLVDRVVSLDQGSVCLFGDRSPRDLSTRALLGFAPQSLALYPELTAIENLAFFGGLYGLSGKALGLGVARALALAGLEERGRDRVSTF